MSAPGGGTDVGSEGPLAFTVGHSTRSAETFVSLLEENGVGLLVDVRRHPGSRRHPQFNQGELEETLAGRGIDYRPEERLGGRRDPSPGESPNRAWESESFRAYADHLLTGEGRRALDQLQAEGRTDTHSLRRMAEVADDGRVVYPGTEAEQEELFE